MYTPLMTDKIIGYVMCSPVRLSNIVGCLIGSLILESSALHQSSHVSRLNPTTQQNIVSYFLGL